MMRVPQLFRFLGFLAAALAAALAAPLAGAQECVVVQDGVAAAVLVDAAGLAAQLGEALADFQECVHRMSGVGLEVAPQARAGLASIRLQVGAGGLPPEDQAALAALNVEGFLLRVRDGQAWIAGRSGLAVQHGLYWLLERWGCRWLFPGEAGAVLPARATLVIGRDLETSQQPFFLMRNLWYNYARRLPAQVQEERREWERRNRLTYSLAGSIGHAYDRFLSRKDDRLYAAQPESFPLRWGRRSRQGQVCTCNPKVRERAVNYALGYFRANPEAAMVSMSPNDSGGAWRCPECKGVRSFTDAALGLANYVADALQQVPETRGKLVSLYAYLDTARPPSFDAHEKVIVFLATRLTITPWTRLAPAWRRKVSHLGIRDYASILDWHWTRPVWGLESLKKKVRLWLELGVEAVSVESGNDWGGWGLYHYVLARLLWDPRQEAEEIVEDYLKKGFGSSASIMRRYFERWKYGCSAGIRHLAARDLNRAWTASATAAERLRVERLALYLRHLDLLETYRSARGDRDKALALQALAAFDWRIAPLGIAHTFPLVEVYLRRQARWLGIAEERFAGWKDSRPLSPEEVRSILRKPVN
jgi:hypothetical protein